MLKSLLFAFYQLTRIPMPSIPYDQASNGRAAAFFPVVGFILGSVITALAWISGRFFPEPIQAAILVIGIVLVTGGIHLDGFMDSVDGLFSGRSRERKLEIMRDSRVGAFGVIGVVCLLLLKYSLFLSISGPALLWLFPVVLALSRWGMCLAITVFPYARAEGLGKDYASHTGARELIIATLLSLTAAWAIFGAYGLLLLVIGGTAAYLIGMRITKELGGLTGDNYGLINETLEVVLLFVACSIPGIRDGIPYLSSYF